MRTHSRVGRVFGGLAAVLIVLVAALAALPSWVHRWGASGEELRRVYPGDELVAQPQFTWTHAITIKARPEQVWPWIAQIGDTRGGFYSFTFIENLFAKSDLYHNAGRIIPEYQRPAPGQGMIADVLQVKAVEPNHSLLASVPPDTWSETWLWALYPQGQDQTRLIVRLRAHYPPAMAHPAIIYVIDVAGFVMENKMMQGIRDRAQGWIEPPYYQALEIAAWLVALVEGLVAAALFVRRQAWQRPLVAGVGAILALLLFTFVQPALWLRALLDAGLLAGLWWARRAPAPA